MKLLNLKKISAITTLAAVAGASLAACSGTTQGSTAEQTQSEIQTDEAASANTNAQDQSVVKVKLGYLPITHALAILEEKELIEKENPGVEIEPVKFSAWSDLTDALNAGQIDGASVLIELAMSAKSKGVDLKAVALGHKDGNVIITSEDINSAEDLKGKTFAIPSTQSSHNILLNDLLAKGGLTTDDVNVVQLPPPEMPASLASGAIDGYCVAEPFGAQAVSQGVGKVLNYSEELWADSVCCGLVLNNSFITANPEAADTLITKYYEAGEKLEDKTEAKRIASEYLGQSDDVLDTSLQWIHFDDLELTAAEYATLADKVKKYRINEEPPAYTEFIYSK